MRSMIETRSKRGHWGWLCVLGELFMAYSAELGCIVILPWGPMGAFLQLLKYQSHGDQL